MGPDVVVAGAGPAGLLTATLLAQAGLEVRLVDADDHLGGGAAGGDGLLWLPGVPEGERGSRMAVDGYLAALYADELGRRTAFAERAPRLHATLERLGVDLQLVRREPDDYPEEAGARRAGRVFEPRPTDRGQLPAAAPPTRLGSDSLTYAERRDLVTATRNPLALPAAARAWGARGPLRRLLGREAVVGGSALLVGLVAAAYRSGVTLQTETRLTGLEAGLTPTVELETASGSVTLTARRGVVIATGGFARDPRLRAEHLGTQAPQEWSSAAPLADGTAVRLASALGAATSALGAYRRPCLRRADGSFVPLTVEHCLPHSIVVDPSGTRFVNEAVPLTELGRALAERAPSADPDTPPAHLVLDQDHRLAYALGPWPPGIVPVSATRTEEVVRAGTLVELAARCGVDAAGLVGTVARFNAAARQGRDDDLGRGRSARDRAHGAPWSRRGGGGLGPVDRPPYYAVPLYPCDVATWGGLETDAQARVLSPSGQVVDGVWAVGSAAASVWGDVLPGPGAALASALVDAMTAADCLGSLPPAPGPTA